MVDDEDREEPVQAVIAESHRDPTAWLEPIFREHSKAVMQAAYRVTGNADDAEDVLQTVFFRLARLDSPPDFAGNPLPYLRRAATNAALDIVQSKRVRTSVAFDGIGEAVTHDPAPGPHDVHRGREIQRRLRDAIGRLNRRAAQVFTLRYFEGLDNKAIAAALGTSPGTVAVTLHRTREKLKAEMAPLMGETR